MKITDQTGHSFQFKGPAKRVVSLVPSQTELLYFLGIAPVAQTLFCVHPSVNFKSSVKIGGTKTVKIDHVLKLKPDLVLGNKEENVLEQIEELRSSIPTWISDVNSLEDALEMIHSVGMLTELSEITARLSASIVSAFKRLDPYPSNPPTALYLIWRDPYMAVGNQTFIHDMLVRSGMRNILEGQNRYPVITPEHVRELAPDRIYLSTEPYPFKTKHIAELHKICPKAEVMIVDGEMFSWYGSRLLHAPEYFFSLR